MRHDRAPVSQAELPRTVVSTAQRKQSGVTDGHGPQACKHAQPLTARTPWYGEGNSKTAHPTSNEGTDGQAERAGPQGPEASGIKAGWPRLAEARGAAREPDGGTPGRNWFDYPLFHRGKYRTSA